MFFDINFKHHIANIAQGEQHPMLSIMKSKESCITCIQRTDNLKVCCRDHGNDRTAVKFCAASGAALT